MPAAPGQRYAIALVEHDGGELLFLRRAPVRVFAPGLWGFPAGHLEAGETPRACIERELAEELGPAVRLEAGAERGPVHDPLFEGRIEVHLFHYRWRGGMIRLNEEHTDWTWAGPALVAALDTAPGVLEDIAWLGLWPGSAVLAAHARPAPGA
mgnify:CR=1 FL=1